MTSVHHPAKSHPGTAEKIGESSAQRDVPTPAPPLWGDPARKKSSRSTLFAAGFATSLSAACLPRSRIRTAAILSSFPEFATGRPVCSFVPHTKTMPRAQMPSNRVAYSPTAVLLRDTPLAAPGILDPAKIHLWHPFALARQCHPMLPKSESSHLFRAAYAHSRDPLSLRL